MPPRVTPSAHVVGDEAHRLRLDRFLAAVRPELGRHRIDRLLRTGAVRVDGRPHDAHYFVKRGERVEVRSVGAPAEAPVAGEAPAATEAGTEAPWVIAATPQIAVVAKPPGWTTNPVGGAGPDLLAWLTAEVARRAAAGGVARSRPAHPPGVLHRLDREASGLVLFSLTPAAHRRVMRAFRERRLEKIYLALVAGRAASRAFSIDEPLARDRSGRMRPSRAGLDALTECRVLHAGRGASLLEVRPVTGRTHQIRAHLAAIGHPVLGDPLYGAPASAADVPRLWLHAWRIRFPQRLAAALGMPGQAECALWPDLARHLARRGIAVPLAAPPSPL
jgi:23S rRNA pseudouridine1911/1915/1917 synthase